MTEAAIFTTRGSRQVAIDPDIAIFIEAIGTTEPSEIDESYGTFRRMSKRRNYFLLDGRFLIVKISRVK